MTEKSDSLLSGSAQQARRETEAGAGADANPGGLLQVLPVLGRRDIGRFIDVPRAVYVNDPVWVPPLTVERRVHLSPRNPFLDHAHAKLWIATRGGRPVGRISAQVDDLHQQQHGDGTGYFGFFEAIDDFEVCQTLFAAAEVWLREQGMRRVVGPFSYSINDEVGLLVDGFETPPMLMMPHGRPHYDARIKDLGYLKAKDVVAYMLDPFGTPPPVMQASVKRAASWGITVRPMNKKNLKQELTTIREIFNDAWADNWGFVAFTEAELELLGQTLRLFVPADYVQIAEVNGEPQAFIVVVPNLNELIRDLNGRLLPLGWLRLLWRLARGASSARVPLMGVRKRYQRSAIGMAQVFLLLDAVKIPLRERGVRQVELSWVLEDNRPMRQIMERLGARTYKTYRVYEKSLV